jgi:hypothetical protein
MTFDTDRRAMQAVAVMEALKRHRPISPRTFVASSARLDAVRVMRRSNRPSP